VGDAVASPSALRGPVGRRSAREPAERRAQVAQLAVAQLREEPVADRAHVHGVLAFVALGLLTDGAWALAAGGAGERVRRSARVRAWLDRVSGATYVGLGAAAALGGERGGRT